MTGAFALLLGVLAGLGAADLPGTAWMACAALAIVITVTTSLRHCECGRLLTCVLAGLWLASSSASRWLDLRVLPAGADTRVLLEGVVVSVPEREGTELRFDAQVTIRAGAAADTRVRHARLSWRDAPHIPRVGERWRWVVRLSAPEPTRNFVGADLARIAFRDRVHLTGRVLPAALNERLLLAHTSIDGARARIAARISDSVGDPDAAALLTALAVGLTAGMSLDQWRVFNATGTTHLVAISGLHVTLFALLAFCGARWTWRWLPFATRIEREPFALLSGLAAAGLYSLLAGFSVPTQRTWLMLAVFSLARLGARHLSAARGWSLALIAVLLFDPFAPLAAGFWLSFVAVGVILLVETSSLVPARRGFGLLRLQLAVMVALAPLTFAVFDGVSLAGLWVNLLAIPIMSFVLVPLVLLGGLAALLWPALCAPIFGIAAALYEWLWPGLVWAAEADLARWQMTPPLWWFAFALACGWLLLCRWPWPLRTTGCVMALPLLFAASRMPEAGTAQVSVFDTRGTAILIATRDHVLLFDTGDGWNTHGSPARQLVLPALAALGRERIDLLILPALNADRAQGAALLADQRGLAHIVVGGGWPATSLPASRCRDSRFTWDGVNFETWVGGGGSRYCVLRVSVDGHGVVLAGDMDAAAERGLLRRLPAGSLASEAAVLGRQASSLASSAEWIEAVAPGWAIATGGAAETGTRIRTLARWRESGAQVLDTRRDGAVELDLGTKGTTLRRIARSARYPFHWRRSETAADAQSNGQRRAPV
ncbi:MAG: DNA internalization-related competence protein ComEC/Rec2 [Pseudomonadota bacterium]